jgi:hypothetical protein
MSENLRAFLLGQMVRRSMRQKAKIPIGRLNTKLAFSPYPTNYTHTDTWVEKAWNIEAPDDFSVDWFWCDGTYVYYSRYDEQYVFKNGVWEEKDWGGIEPNGRYIWSDGVNIHWASNGAKGYVLKNGVWEEKTWDVSVFGGFTWTDGTNVYCSNSLIHYVLKNGVWEEKTWNIAFMGFRGEYIWSDGENIYHNYSGADYVLKDGMWEKKTWNIPTFSADNIWTDGTNVYCSVHKTTGEYMHYVLKNGVWEEKTWKFTEFTGDSVWTDGTRIYLTRGWAPSYVLV